MDIQIRNLTVDGTKYRGRVSRVAYDAGAAKWKGAALWRSNSGVTRGDVESDTLDGLAAAAADLLLPEPPPV